MSLPAFVQELVALNKTENSREAVIKASSIRTIRKATLAPFVSPDRIDAVVDAYSSIDDESFQTVVAVLKSLKEQATSLIKEQEPEDLTTAILKAKYGRK